MQKFGLFLLLAFKKRFSLKVYFWRIYTKKCIKQKKAELCEFDKSCV